MEEKTSELDEKALKPTQTEQQKVKRIFKNEKKKKPKRPRGEGGGEQERAPISMKRSHVSIDR